MQTQISELPGRAPRPALPPFTIRPARMGDVARVGKLLADSYAYLLAPDYGPEELSAALPFITRPRASLLSCGTYYLADTGDGLLAAGGWTFHAPGGGATGPREVGHIRHVATAPHATRQGVGRALMEHAMFEAQMAGVRRLMCYSTRTARDFYAALGFRAQGEISVTLAPGLEFSAVQMCCDL
ncbi:GNAT family N-acetyltransferase [Vannielia litorea]|uniref:Ribosomal protein S18 acetylase RimI n=1 Tax=Vannielia litorea TaxID=1217970 RepID=A0A1N6EG53_9RHOB|nr:GNAT family N-acetyltransferase [Vannielia litorea]SIN81877.1 Ribosomal protein S18 acetylase RimI [Vannielia litorea]